MVPARIQGKELLPVPHIPQRCDARSPPASLIRYVAMFPRCRTDSSMLTMLLSATHTPKSKMDLSGVVKHKLGAFVRHHLHRLPPRRTQSSRNSRRMLPLTVIPHPHRSRVARRFKASACRTRRFPCRPRPPQLHHNSTPVHMEVVRRIRRLPQLRPQCNHCARQHRQHFPTTASCPRASTNRLSDSSQLLSRVCRVDSHCTLRTWRTK